jgi:hypothetical protein
MRACACLGGVSLVAPILMNYCLVGILYLVRQQEAGGILVSVLVIVSV